MTIKDNFGNPQGWIGKLMLTGMNKGHTPMSIWAFELFEVPDCGNIADIGCGGGLNVKRLIEKSNTAMVYGVDISETSVMKSKSVNKKYLETRCKILKGSAENLSFKDDSMDLVTAFETVYFWNNIENCFLEIKRVLKNNGKFIIVNDPGDPDKHWDEMIPDMVSWKPEELEKILQKTGFKNIQIFKSKFKYCVIGCK